MSCTKKFEFKSDLKPFCPYCKEEIDIEDLVEGGTGIHQKISTIKITSAPVAFMTLSSFIYIVEKSLE